MTDKLEKIDSDEHVQWLIREERRAVYQMVAGALLARPSIQSEDDFAVCSVNYYAEAIYQGMVKFCGEAK